MAEIQGPLEIRDNSTASRYEVAIGDELAVAEYRLRGSTIIFTHTEVPEALEGHGIGSQLAHFALEDARSRGLAVVPRCPFIAEYIWQHPEYQPLVVEQG